ncbi:hypothetical protein [Thiorhodovibrio winogradskyi]|uniref:hypothetical protein n=1 Tax=Thiorhodovibrio winogradskyi TaxID=77007 RepID=UPI002E290F55|nr:hypothetical protein [Thiorhodovibrio winogradskyi]
MIRLLARATDFGIAQMQRMTMHTDYSGSNSGAWIDKKISLQLIGYEKALIFFNHIIYIFSSLRGSNRPLLIAGRYTYARGCIL